MADCRSDGIMKSLEPMQRLAGRLAKLPGVGKRSAERMAYRIALDEKGLARELIAALQDVENQLVRCDRCGNLTPKERNPCELCTDSRRDASLLCVVEDAASIALMETAGGYQGLYHCMDGKISPMLGRDIPPEQLEKLRKRIADEPIKEVVLAFDHDTESEATAHYLQEALSGKSVRITRLAFGLPSGSGVAFADALTLSRAIGARHSM